MPRKRRDGQATADEQQKDYIPGEGDSAQLANGYTRDMAEADMAEVRALNQQISDLQMNVASIFKAIEKKGGDRRTFKWAYQLRYQDPAKTAAQLEAFKEYIAWMVEPEIGRAKAAGSEG